MFELSPLTQKKDEPERLDYGYTIWFLTGVIASLLAIWGTSHYDLLGKIAWTITGPGFTLSQTWNKAQDSLSKALFCVLLVFHFIVVVTAFPLLPKRHFGYILLLAIAEIVTVGMVYQVWLNLRSKRVGANVDGT